ncbi:MAG: histidine kinase [Bacteroidales bacterium]
MLAILVNICYIVGRQNIALDGAGCKFTDGQLYLTAIVPGSPCDKAGLQKGDILLSVESIPVTETPQGWTVGNFKPGDTLIYKIQRSDKVFESRVVLSSMLNQHSWFYFIFYVLIFAVSFFGLFILYKKPFDPSAKVFFLYLQLFAISGNTTTILSDDLYAVVASAFFIMSYILFGTVLIHFHLLFPVKSKLHSKYPFLLLFFYGFSILAALTVALLHILTVSFGFTHLEPLYIFLFIQSNYWMGISLGVALLVAVYQYITLKNSILRKQLQLVITGTVFGICTPIVFSLFREYFFMLGREQHRDNILELLNSIGSYIMIVFFVTAIFRHRIWNIEIILRKAILYTGATLIISTIYLVFLFGIELFTIQETLITRMIILGASVILFLVFRDSIQRIIDRLFFRESYDMAKAVKDFEEKISGNYNLNDLISSITQYLDEIIHFSTFIFMKHQQGLSYITVRSLGIDSVNIQGTITVSREVQLKLLNGDVFTYDEIKATSSFSDLLKGELIVPLPGKDSLFGFFICGMKKSEQSYTLQDIRMLSILARRITAQFHTATLYQRDLDRMLLLERERARIAQDMHDDLGASLTRISMLSEMVKNTVKGDEKTIERLGQITETSRGVTEEMNQIIWALNPKNDNLEGLLAYLRRFSHEFLEPVSLGCTFELPEEIPSIPLSVEERRNIYLSVRESLHNIVKHSGATRVSIKVTLSHEELNILIGDDGIGFSLEKIERQGNGLNNMKKRMLEIGGSFQLESGPGSGTVIHLAIPLVKTSDA